MRVAWFCFLLVFLLLFLPLLTVCALTTSALAKEELPYPAGQSIQQIEGLKTVLVRPDDLGSEDRASLVVVLHGAGGTATGMAGSFTPWAKDGYVVCAPKSKGQTWDPDDLQRVHRIAAHLKDVLPIDPAKVHVVGYSNGGWNLAPLAFDDDLKPCSATWIAAGYNGGQVPRWAKDDLGVIALAGTEDPNVGAARGTVDLLEDKVRTVEVRTEPGLGHAFPRTLMPYLQWWMGIQEGRVVPGEDMSFDWTEDLEAAKASQVDRKKGGVFVWVWAPEDGGEEMGRLVQRELFLDPEIRFLGAQIPCVKLERTAHAETVAAFGVKTTPALVILDRKGKVKKCYQGKIKTSKVARTLRGVVPQRRMPKD